MSRISALIDQAADSSRSLSDVLRQVKIVPSRIGDRELAQWAGKELAGYGPDDELPTYRSARDFPVVGNWSEPFGINDDLLDWFRCEIRWPVAEMEAFSGGSQNQTIRWDPWAVVEYNRRAHNGEGSTAMAMINFIDASLVSPQNALTGVLEVVCTRVLDLALALEDAAPDAGEPDGPTVAD